jgi:hypothetical protein
MAIVLMASAVRVIGGGGIYGVVQPFSGLRDFGSCVSDVAGCGAHTLECTESYIISRPVTKTQGRLMRSKNTSMFVCFSSESHV